MRVEWSEKVCQNSKMSNGLSKIPYLDTQVTDHVNTWTKTHEKDSLKPFFDILFFNIRESPQQTFKVVTVTIILLYI